MSLEDEIKALRGNRKVEQEALLAKEREEALAQLTPEAIARKLIELRVAKPQSAEGVSQLLAVNTPSLISEVATYLQQQGKFGEIKLDRYKGQTIEERDIPTVEVIGRTGEGEDGRWSSVQLQCKQQRRERPFRIGSFSDMGDKRPYWLRPIEIEISTEFVRGSLKMYVSGDWDGCGNYRREIEEQNEQSLGKLVVAALAKLKT